MRSIALAAALAGLILAPLSLTAPAGADELPLNQRETSLKQIDKPNPNMLIRPSQLLNPTPGVENRESQLSAPMRPAAKNAGHPDGAGNDAPEAAANTTTNASRMTASEAAATTLTMGASNQ